MSILENTHLTLLEIAQACMFIEDRHTDEQTRREMCTVNALTHTNRQTCHTKLQSLRSPIASLSSSISLAATVVTSPSKRVLARNHLSSDGHDRSSIDEPGRIRISLP